jgi:hypothetical protein
MMKQTLILIAALPLFFGACDKDDLCLRGSGQTQEYPLELDAFDEVELSGPVDLRITQGAAQAVQVVAEPEMYSALEYRVRNGVLEIGYEGNVRCFETMHGVWVEITVPDLEAVSVSGDSEIVSAGDLDLDMLDITISGMADIDLSGTIADQRFDASGLLEVSNFDVQSNNVSIEISGKGEIDIQAQSGLDIDVSGEATIRYKGTPQITQKSSGLLTLINAN